MKWPVSWSSVHITVKELAPIVLAAAVWGKEWKGKTVRCRCDNAAVVAILRSNSSKHPLVMHLLRCLSFFVAHYQLYLDPVHLPGRCNEAADALSRDNLPVPAARPNSGSGSNPHPREHTRGSGPQNPGVVVHSLDDRAAFYFAQGLASSSVRTYQSGVSRYLRFLSGTGPYTPANIGECFMLVCISIS